MHAALSPDFRSRHLALGLHPTMPTFAWFDVDGLGGGAFGGNVVLASHLPAGDHARHDDGGGSFRYTLGAREVWRVTLAPQRIELRSDFAGDDAATPFVLLIDQTKNHATVLGRPVGNLAFAAPAVLHLPDRGTLRITAPSPATLRVDARRRQPEHFVRIEFPAATRDRPHVAYTLETALIHPALPGLDMQPRYDGYRRNFLNLIQLNPRLGTLANNSSSDACGFVFWMYAEFAAHCPPLAPGLTVFDLLRTSLDRVLAGQLTYGQVGYRGTANYPDAVAWESPFESLDTLPSFVLAGAHCLLAADDETWAAARFAEIVALGRRMLAGDRDGNGLIEYVLSGNSGTWDGRLRPANWWDTIGFGHEDAYANALAFRACERLSAAARRLGHEEVATEFAAAAERVRCAYQRTFFNPATGVLADWRSADGRLHDYWFTFVNGLAISFGLIERDVADALMSRLLAKMAEVGFTRFDLGLPGNLVPVRREDYTVFDRRGGGSAREDGSDGFQIYENGGATHCHAYWTVKALYRLGRVADARRIFHPLLASFAAGDFQGAGADGLSKDWRDWNGGCNGYEGYLSDGYLALLAVEDDLAADDA